MVIFFKKHRSNAAKIIGIALFVFLMFVNLQITTKSLNKGEGINLIGLKLSLTSQSTYAEGFSACCIAIGYICYWGDTELPDYRECNP